MKRLAVIGLASLFILQHLLVVLMFVSFSANRAYIADVLCINKNQTTLDCEGQCFFKAKLAEQQQSSDQKTWLEKPGIEFVDKQPGSYHIQLDALFPGDIRQDVLQQQPHNGFAFLALKPPVA
jgi:hypothetical protein